MESNLDWHSLLSTKIGIKHLTNSMNYTYHKSTLGFGTKHVEALVLVGGPDNLSPLQLVFSSFVSTIFYFFLGNMIQTCNLQVVTTNTFQLSYGLIIPPIRD